MLQRFIEQIRDDLRVAKERNYEVVPYKLGLDIFVRTGPLPHEKRRIQSWSMCADQRSLTRQVILETSEMDTCSLHTTAKMDWLSILAEARDGK